MGPRRPGTWLLAVVLVLAACTEDDGGAVGGEGTDPTTCPNRIEVDTGATPLEGCLFPAGDGSPAGGVVLAHQNCGSQEGWYPTGHALGEAGYATLAFDFSDGCDPSDAPALAEEIANAVTELRERGVADVAVIGASMGGTAALVTAASTDLAAVATLSAPAAFDGLDAAGSAVSVDEPGLVVAAADNQPYADDAGSLAAALGTEAVVLAGDAHGTALLDEHGEQLTARLVSHLDGALGRGGPDA